MINESTTRCEKCNLEIIPDSWAEAGWGLRPHCGVGICSCAFGMPPILEGDLLVDRGYFASFADHQTYGYNGKNIMRIQRKNERGIYVEIWHNEDCYK